MNVTTNGTRGACPKGWQVCAHRLHPHAPLTRSPSRTSAITHLASSPLSAASSLATRAFSISLLNQLHREPLPNLNLASPRTTSAFVTSRGRPPAGWRLTMCCSA